MGFDLDVMKQLFPASKKPVHTLKWGFPEARYTAPMLDIEKAVAQLKKTAKFAGGGEYIEQIYAKEYGEGVYAYFIVRTDKKTEQETVFSDAYMLREEDKLGFDVQTTYKISQDFEQMGYKHVFDREIMVWSFRSILRIINAFDITEFGNFVEIGLPATKVASMRDTDEKWAQTYLERLGIKKEDIIPTDPITLQLVTMLQAERAAQQQEASGKPERAGGKSLGMGAGKGKSNLF